MKGQDVTARPRKKTSVPGSHLSFRDRLAAARLPERVIEVCLRNELYTEIERLDTELNIVQQKTPVGTMAVNPDVRRLMREIDAVREEMAAYSEPFLLRAIPQPEFVQMKADHPPRAGDPQDHEAGLNRDVMTEVLLRRCIVTPEFTDDLWQEFLRAITDWQYEQLAATAWGLNRGEVSVPFSSAALRVKRYDSELKRPAP